MQNSHAFQTILKTISQSVKAKICFVSKNYDSPGGFVFQKSLIVLKSNMTNLLIARKHVFSIFNLIRKCFAPLHCSKAMRLARTLGSLNSLNQHKSFTNKHRNAAVTHGPNIKKNETTQNTISRRIKNFVKNIRHWEFAYMK